MATATNDPTWKSLYDSPLKDRLVSRSVRDSEAERLEIGSTLVPASVYPDYVLAGFEPGEPGFQVAWYVKDRANQKDYNYEFSCVLSDEFGPHITQDFIVRRAAYVPYSQAAADAEAPPTFDNAYTWTFMEEVQVKLPMPLHGLYVGIKRTWRDLTQPVMSQSVDEETGAVRTSYRSMVPADTAAEPINNSGVYSEVQGMTPQWAIKTVRQAAGIAGAAVNGISTRQIQRHVRHYWPPVLDSLFHRTVYVDPGNAFSDVRGHLFYPIWASYDYSGPCKATMTERWTKLQPTFTGNPAWPSGGGVPYLPAPTVLLPRPINFQGVDGFGVNVESCLHGAYDIVEEGFWWHEPATEPERWPGSILADVDLRPFLGGWMTSWVDIEAPSTKGQFGTLVLSLASRGINSVVLAWNSAGAGTTLDVSTTPDFSRGFIKLNQAVNSTAPLEYTLTGLSPSTIYFARLKRTGNIVSNTLQFMARPQSLLVVLDANDTTLTSGVSTLAFGSAAIETEVELLITLRNDGVLPMEQLSVSFTGTDASSWSVAEVPSRLERGDSAQIRVTFSPEGAVGAKTATLRIATDDPASPFLLALTGTATDPEINVKYLGTSYATGGTVPLAGSVNTGANQSYTLVIENTGTGVLAVQVGLVGDEFTLTDAPISVAAGGSANITILFEPTGAGTRAATLNIVNTDRDENPYVLTLNGTGVAVGEIEVQDPLGQVLIDAGSSYNFGTVDAAGSANRVKTVTILNRGAGTLSSLAVSKSGTNAADFTLGALGSTSLAGGASTTFSITFDPSAVGARIATISIASSDADENPFTFDVTGTGGTGPDIQVEQPAPTIIADDGSLAFGSVLSAGSNTVVKVFTIRNLGTSDLTVTSVNITGTNSADFSVSGITLPATVAADGTTTFSVTFNPSGLGTRAATLTLANNASSVPKQSYVISLSGTGTPANALVTYQSASVVIGQADFDDQLTTGTGIIDTLSCGVAVSASGRLAIAVNYGLVYIYNTVPVANGTAPDVILNGPAFAYGIAWSGNDLLVSDYYNNRVLRFAGPLTSYMSPTNVIGQPNLSTTSSGTTAAKLWVPAHIMVSSTGKLIVCDRANHRVLIWNSVPTTNGVSANVVVGQSNFTTRATGNSANRMEYPMGVAEHPDGQLLITDGNSRCMVFPSIPTSNNASAGYVLLHQGFGIGVAGSGQTSCDQPLGVACNAAGQIAIADFNNNRVMLFYEIPTTSFQPAHAVLGQSTFGPKTAWGGLGGPNAQVMQQPYGVCWNGNDLIVTGGMKRAMIFTPA